MIGVEYCFATSISGKHPWPDAETSVFAVSSDNVRRNQSAPFFVFVLIRPQQTMAGKRIAMPAYRITVKCPKVTGGQRVERGMSVEVVSNSFSNPVISDKAAVANAFYRIYGIDFQAIGALSTAYLDSERIG